MTTSSNPGAPISLRPLRKRPSSRTLHVRCAQIVPARRRNGRRGRWRTHRHPLTAGWRPKVAGSTPVAPR